MLSNRLSTIKELVPFGSKLADIGSDHCLLPIALFKDGICHYLQAIDNKKGPYLSMESAVKKEGLEGKIDLSLSDGLTCLDERVDTLVLAGMGGKLAVRILEEGKKKLDRIETIIIDPHRDLEFTRASLASLGYRIDEERVIFEGDVYYFVIRFKKGDVPAYSKEDLLFGPIARRRREKTFVDFLSSQRKRIKAILTKPLSVQAQVGYRDMLDLVNAELNRG